MPEEIFVLCMLSVLCGTGLVISLIIANVKVQRAKLLAQSGGAKEGLTATELRRLVEEAVSAATQPLHDKIDQLEEELLQREAPPALPEGRRVGLFDGVASDEAEAPVPAARPRLR